MTILCWDKPKKVLTTEDWKNSYGFEDGPTGGYVPNMSKADMKKWKAKLVGHTTEFPQVEIRKTCGGSQLTVIVNLGKGYNYKYYTAVDNKNWGTTTKGIQIHMALNGPAQMSFVEMAELNEAVQEAKYVLEHLKPPVDKK